ncbi:MAG: alpha-amylase family glycosyl hydrolase [Bacteroidota bacterium]
MYRYFLVLVLLVAATAEHQDARAQTQNVVFRYVDDPDVVRAYLPGEFNGWGPNNSGAIAINAPSAMTLDDSLGQWLYTQPLTVGQTYQYKVHLHFDEAGSDWQWISDPLNPVINTADNNNSVIEVTDPMAFQASAELNEDGLMASVSAGLFSTSSVTDVQFWINGLQRDGLPFFDPETGLFSYTLDRPIKAGSQFKVVMTDQNGAQDSVEVGEVLPPITWNYADFKTVQSQVNLSASIFDLDGTIDSTLTEAILINTAGELQSIPVENGRVDYPVMLEFGVNSFALDAIFLDIAVRSDTLRIERIRHPLEAGLVDASVSSMGNSFTVSLSPTDIAPADMEVSIRFDKSGSTTTLDDVNINNLEATGTASDAGELYFDVTASAGGEEVDHMRVALVVEEDGSVREMAYEETPSWVNKAMVYEIFPLSFGPEATGTVNQPGNRFNQITDNLEYIAAMGFNTLWFMPVMHNQVMDQISGGYNIIDFYNVDPKLGTNEDFKALVDRAHDLDIRVIMDITPNHSSPTHPWVDALQENGNAVPPGSFIQTEPSDHSRGLDNRGPNLTEIWQVAGGGNLYRKYDGFGDLANLDWDNDDLQAEFLNILKHWITEFGIDGWRFDVYWGPWRRYGPERFGRPIRDLMKRIKPDSWILGEIAGTGFSTEVYYTDDDNGTTVVGGMDAGYDWNFFFNGIGGTYGDLNNYHNQAFNGGFWPGPNARYFRFLENHDEERIAKRLGNNPMQILPLTGMLLTTTGVPMIYQGQEVNFGNVNGDERRVSVNWETELNGLFGRYHQQLAQARQQFPAFGTQNLVRLSTSNDVYAFARPYLDENALVMVNFANGARTIQIDPTAAMELTTDGPITYTHLFADTSFVDALDGFSVTLDPYETAVFIANNGEPVSFSLPEMPSLPFGAVYVGTDALAGGDTPAFGLHANYPNPFTSVTTIPYAIDRSGAVRLEVFDVLGRRVATLVDENKLSGVYQATWGAARVAPGVYFARLVTGEKTATTQLVIAR